MSSLQDEFDGLVENFNSDYIALLRRAASGEYDRLVELFLNLKDLHDVIVMMHDVEDLEFRTPLYPITLRANAGLLRELGFSDDEIRVIGHFFEVFRQRVGKDLEEVGRT